MSPRRLTILSVAAGLVACVLFAWTLHTAGLPEILAGIRRIGAGGFAVIVVLSGFRLAVRALAWKTCLEPESPLGFRQAFAAVLMGEALGNITPLGTVVSEPSKVAFVRSRVSVVPAFSALVVENLFYVLSLGLVIALGGAAFLFVFRAGEELGAVAVASLGVAGIVGLVCYAMLLANARPLTMAFSWMKARGILPAPLARHADGVASLEATVNAFTRKRRGRLLPLVALETSFHAAGIAETWVALYLMGALAGTGGPGLLEALVLESTGRVVNLLFRFVPFRLGVDEAGAALVANALGLGPAAGGALALTRKARLLAWTAVGVGFLVARGFSVGHAVEQAKAARQAVDEAGPGRIGEV